MITLPLMREKNLQDLLPSLRLPFRTTQSGFCRRQVTRYRNHSTRSGEYLTKSRILPRISWATFLVHLLHLNLTGSTDKKHLCPGQGPLDLLHFSGRHTQRMVKRYPRRLIITKDCRMRPYKLRINKESRKQQHLRSLHLRQGIHLDMATDHTIRLRGQRLILINLSPWVHLNRTFLAPLVLCCLRECKV